jgi:hypothetical protein
MKRKQPDELDGLWYRGQPLRDGRILQFGTLIASLIKNECILLHLLSNAGFVEQASE